MELFLCLCSLVGVVWRWVERRPRWSLVVVGEGLVWAGGMICFCRVVVLRWLLWLLLLLVLLFVACRCGAFWPPTAWHILRSGGRGTGRGGKDGGRLLGQAGEPGWTRKNTGRREEQVTGERDQSRNRHGRDGRDPPPAPPKKNAVSDRRRCRQKGRHKKEKEKRETEKPKRRKTKKGKPKRRKTEKRRPVKPQKGEHGGRPKGGGPASG